MTYMDVFFTIDTWLITPFRWIGSAQTGFLLGTAVLAVQSVLVGKLCLYAMSQIQHRLRHAYDHEIIHHQDMSMQALAAKDKTAYLAENHLAQDAYGKSMSLAMGRMGASLWPAVMALAWMKVRFQDAPFPLPDWVPGRQISISYATVFILIYMMVHFTFRSWRSFIKPESLVFQWLNQKP